MAGRVAPRSYTFIERCKEDGYEGLGEVAEAENQRLTKEEMENFKTTVGKIVLQLKNDFQKLADAYLLLERGLPRAMIYETPTQLMEELNERVLDRVYGEEMVIRIDDDPERELTIFKGPDTWQNFRDAHCSVMIGIQDLDKEAKEADKMTQNRRMAQWERLLKVHKKEMRKMGYGRRRKGPTNLPVDWFQCHLPQFRYKAMEMMIGRDRVSNVADNVYRDKETMRYATIDMMEAGGDVNSD